MSENQKEPLDLYPAVGNIVLPFSESRLSPQKAARLRRLTQYYIEVDGPTSIWRPQQLVESSEVHVFKRNFFALIMTEPIMIEMDGRTKENRVPRGLEDHLIGIEMLCSGLSLDDGLLWAAVVIAASNDNPQVPSANKWLILDHMLDSATDGLLNKWEDVKQRMMKYFWNKAAEESWETCWKVALDRKKKRDSNKEKSGGASTS